MSKQDEAGLILKLYELRREETMRQARDWYFLKFNPESIGDYTQALFSENSGHLRMVVSYWEMAAAFVNHGAISLELFDETQSEHISVFAKIEPLLSEIRSLYNPSFAANLEKLIDKIPNGRERVAATRERIKIIRARSREPQSKAAQQS